MYYDVESGYVIPPNSSGQTVNLVRQTGDYYADRINDILTLQAPDHLNIIILYETSYSFEVLPVSVYDNSTMEVGRDFVIYRRGNFLRCMSIEHRVEEIELDSNNSNIIILMRLDRNYHVNG